VLALVHPLLLVLVLALLLLQVLAQEPAAQLQYSRGEESSSVLY
jgi:hypothetical protein